MPSRDYRDPAQVAAEREIAEKRQEYGQCYGCQHWSRVFGISWCQRRDEPANKRCEEYVE